MYLYGCYSSLSGLNINVAPIYLIICRIVWLFHLAPEGIGEIDNHNFETANLLHQKRGRKLRPQTQRLVSIWPITHLGTRPGPPASKSSAMRKDRTFSRGSNRHGTSPVQHERQDLLLEGISYPEWRESTEQLRCK